MDTTGLICVVIGGMGLVILLGSLLFGELGTHIELGGHLELGGHVETDGGSTDGTPSIFSLSVISTALVGFGVAGFVTHSLGAPAVAAFALAIVGSILLATLMLYGILRPLAEQQSSSMLGRDSYRGLVADVTLTIPPAGFGEVSFTDANGANVTERAFPQDPGTILRGAPVLIVDVKPDGVIVMPSDQTL